VLAGYAGYYGLSLIAGSYAVLFASLAGHAAQFAFLQFFENPRELSRPLGTYPGIDLFLLDIERTYGQRKLLAQRTPLMQRLRKSEPIDKQDSPSESTNLRELGNCRNISAACGSSAISSYRDPAELMTPNVTEGETATDTELETETENENDVISSSRSIALLLAKRSLTPRSSVVGTSSSATRTPSPVYPALASQHDLMNSYFRKDALLLANIDLLRQVWFVI
jgi:phosphatidylethanolamine N-methyltransferase